MKTRRLLTSLVLGMGLTLALLGLLSGRSVLSVHATSSTVNNTDDSGTGSLRQAIIDANSDTSHDIIDFNVTGVVTLESPLPPITETLTISGPGAGQLAVSGNDAHRVFSVTDGVAVTITGLTVRGGNVSGNGAGIWSAGEVHLSAVRILSNTASSWGGGLYVNDGSATLTGTHVVSNSASYGGGMYVDEGSATLNVSGGKIEGNEVSNNGGGVSVRMGNATLTGTQVVSNSAGSGGGGVYVFASWATLNMNGGRIEGNEASDNGGGMHVTYGSATLSGTQVVSNSAGSSGSGVYIAEDSATLNVNGGRIEGNEASFGGGVHINNGDATLIGTQVVSNSAGSGGGGIAVIGGSAMLGGTQIAANDASFGSALANMGTVILMTPLTIAGDIYQMGGLFSSNYDLRIEGSLSLDGGHFYAPEAFTLTSFFTHTAGTYHQTQIVSGSNPFGFPKAGGVIINANNQDLGSTEVALTARDVCAGVTTGEAINHCYTITPTNSSGRDATVTFFYRSGEIPADHACSAMEAYRWDNTWDNLLTRDTAYDSDGRMCGANPLSIQVTNVMTFSPFALRGPVADVRISKGVTPTTAAPGAPITYNLAFSNAGAITATGVVITDSFPVSVTHDSLRVDSNVDITTTGTISYTWEVKDLSADESGLITITGVLSNPLTAGTFTNTAFITTTSTDNNPDNNSDTASVTAKTADLKMVKSVSSATANPGEAVTYTLAFSNAGNDIATKVVITDTIPASVTNTSVVSSGVAITQRVGTRYAWDVQDLTPNDSGVITITGVLSDSLAAGTFTNTAVITTTSSESTPGDNENSAGITVTKHTIYLPLVLRNVQ